MEMAMYDPPGFRIQLAQQQPTPSAAPSVTATDRPGVVINLPPGGPAPKSAQRGLDDVASIVQPLIWPLILLVLAIAFRRTLADFFFGCSIPHQRRLIRRRGDRARSTAGAIAPSHGCGRRHSPRRYRQRRERQ